MTNKTNKANSPRTPCFSHARLRLEFMRQPAIPTSRLRAPFVRSRSDGRISFSFRKSPGRCRSADFQSAGSRISNPQTLRIPGLPPRAWARRLEVGDTAGWETCAPPGMPACNKLRCAQVRRAHDPCTATACPQFSSRRTRQLESPCCRLTVHGKGLHWKFLLESLCNWGTKRKPLAPPQKTLAPEALIMLPRANCMTKCCHLDM